MSKYLLTLLPMFLTVNAFSSETYICSISEAIEVEFKHGKWINTAIDNGRGIFRVTINNKKAQVVEQGNGNDGIKTECNLVGGTVGYKCEDSVKITPKGERFKIQLFPLGLKELTIDSEFSMRDMAAYDSNSKTTNKYFNQVHIKTTKSYGKCVELK